MLYHFVLTYSNWETGTMCYSESFESLLEGLQNALWELGGAPCGIARTGMSAAVNTRTARRVQPAVPGPTGALRSGRGEDPGGATRTRTAMWSSAIPLKRALEQALLLRGGRDFASLAGLRAIRAGAAGPAQCRTAGALCTRNGSAGPLPPRRLDDWQRVEAKVGPQQHDQRATQCVLGSQPPDRRAGPKPAWRPSGGGLVRASGWWRAWRGCAVDGRQRINYRHVIDWLVRKPGAFERYLYREELFPTQPFPHGLRCAVAANPARGHKRIPGDPATGGQGKRDGWMMPAQC